MNEKGLRVWRWRRGELFVFKGGEGAASATEPAPRRAMMHDLRVLKFSLAPLTACRDARPATPLARTTCLLAQEMLNPVHMT